MSLTDCRACRECTAKLEPTRNCHAEFCNAGCRIAWRNRRASRGAELYDVFMAIRFNRKAASALGLWALMCRMASNWKDEDRAADRQSYFKPEEAATRCVVHTAVIVKKR